MFLPDTAHHHKWEICFTNLRLQVIFQDGINDQPLIECSQLLNKLLSQGHRYTEAREVGCLPVFLQNLYTFIINCYKNLFSPSPFLSITMEINPI